MHCRRWVPAVAIVLAASACQLSAPGTITALGPPSTQGGLVEEPHDGFCEAADKAGQVNTALGGILRSILSGSPTAPAEVTPEVFRAGASQLATAKPLLIESYNTLAAVSSPELAADVLRARVRNEEVLDAVIAAGTPAELIANLPEHPVEEEQAAVAAVYRVNVVAKTKCGVSFTALWGA